MTAMPSCRKEYIPNEVYLKADSVDYSNKGQFLTIVSEQEWSIQTYSLSSETQDWFSVSPSSGTGSRNDIALSYTENTTTASRKVSIAVIFPNETITVVFTQGPKKGGGGGGSTDKLVSDKVNSWMELPRPDTSSTRAYISHHTTISGKSVRNYSMLYDGENRIALWVAYPLCSAYIGSTDRTDVWVYDPKIPQGMQPLMSGGYARLGYDGYDRGHQIPSADRTANQGMNADTFFYANQTPQSSSLNQGIWAKLEMRVRGYKDSCDTLYVVTGCVIKTEDDPNITYFIDYAGNNMAVPKAYFKVLLKYTIKSNRYQAIGFWYKNEPYGYREPEVSDAQPIKWIEERTGFSFFTNLPEDVAVTVKNEFKPSEWGL